MQFSKKIPTLAFLPGGCIVELDALGLPALPRIQHVATCACGGQQDELLRKMLIGWLGDWAQRLQIDTSSAFLMVLRLIDKWEIGNPRARKLYREEMEKQHPGWDVALARRRKGTPRKFPPPRRAVKRIKPEARKNSVRGVLG